MEVARSNYLPGDPRLIDNIVYELKSQGIFDNFRKECISDVDTKPAYQNLRQRVEGSVIGFLKTQQWSSDMNKNQVREMLRKTISESGFLETGVERIVDQVVNPKINSIFFPQVENIVYKFLGIEKPAENSNIRRTFVNTSNIITITTNDLLPNDLEAVSPDNEGLDKNLNPNTSNDSQKVEDIKIDEDESPPFEAIEETVFPPQEDLSIESHLSGISDLTSHDSNQSFGTSNKTTEMDITNEEPLNSMDGASQNCKDEIDNKLSGQESESTKDKLEINEDFNCSTPATDVIEPSLQVSFGNILEQVTAKDSVVTNVSSNNAKTDDDTLKNSTVENKPKNNNLDDDNKPKKSDSKQHKKYSSDKYTNRDHKSEKDKKSDNYKSDKHKSRHSSKSSNDREKDDKDSKASKKSDSSRSDKERKNDKHHNKSRHSSSHHGRDKSSKNSTSESGEYKSDSKSKHSSRSKSPKRDVTYDESNSKEVNNKDPSKKDGLDHLSKEKKGKEKYEKESSKKYSNDSKHSKDKSSHRSHSKSKSESSSHHSSRDRGDSKSRTKHNDEIKSDDVIKNSTHRHEAKHNSKSEKYSSSSKKDKRDKDRKESKNDDHYNSKEKKFNRRSTDRDSSDGRSGTHSSSSSFTESYSSSQLQKTNDDSSKINSGSNSGDSGNSDQTEVKPADQNTIQNTTANEYQHVRLIKPKFASNIFEARRLLKIRKKISKLERQNQMKLLNNTTPSVHNSFRVNDSIKENAVKHQTNDNEGPFLKEGYLKKDVTIKRQTVTLNSVNVEEKSEHQKSTIRKSISKEVLIEERPDETMKSPSPLHSAVISKESWDAIEAKLNSTNVLNVDYNSYVDVSEDIEDVELTLPQKINAATVDVTVSSCDKIETIAKEENQDQPNDLVETNETIVGSQESMDLPSNDDKVEVPKETKKDGELNKNCLYLVPEVLPETQRYFDKIANRITLLEEEIARRTKLLILHMENQKNNDSEIDVSTRLPKIDIVDVNTDTEIVISPSKSANCQIKIHQDVHNNNKRKLQFDDVEEINENISNQTTTLNTSENSNTALKAKKVKLAHNSVGDIDFSLPLSPADSDNSISSNSEKQKSNSRTSRRTSSRQQSYTSDDLYKPRLRFTSSRRRFLTNTASAAKN